MNGRDTSKAMGALALSDSLGTLRTIIAPAVCSSAADVVAAAAAALVGHQDFDGCEVIVRGAVATLDISSRGGVAEERPPGLDALLATEVVPAVLDRASVCRTAFPGDMSGAWGGSLLAAPIGQRNGISGGLIVWNAGLDHFMPWHQLLLEMVAEVVLLQLNRLQLDALAAAGDPDCDGGIVSGGPSKAVDSDDDRPTVLDALTGLPDRPSFEARMGAPAVTGKSGLKPAFVLYIDVDRFRFIRENCGTSTSELVLRMLAELLAREAGDAAIVGRLGDDEFGWMLACGTLQQAVVIAESIVNEVDAWRIQSAGQRREISISVGIAPCAERSTACAVVLRQAMRACRVAQRHGGGMVQVYHPGLNQTRGGHQDGRMLDRLTRALKEDGLILYAQPIVPLGPSAADAPRRLHLHELLLRLRTERDGVLSAGEFLQVAERYGLSVKLDRWVIQNAFAAIAQSALADDADHRFTLNLSGHSIDNRDLLDFITGCFDETGLSPDRICFEITETAAISDLVAAKGFVETLQAIGCEFALDDFGSGHSTFQYLRDLPVEYLKIDGALVRDIEDDPVSLALVRTIEGVGRIMGRQTIAEHVHSSGVLEAVTELGCDYAQGHWVGRPIPLADLLAQK